MYIYLLVNGYPLGQRNRRVKKGRGGEGEGEGIFIRGRDTNLVGGGTTRMIRIIDERCSA